MPGPSECRSNALIQDLLNVMPVQFHKPYKIHEIPTPKELGEHDLLIKVAVASLCHTDSMALEGIMGSKLPLTASHEGTGTVVSLGSSVKGFKAGDRVLAGVFFHRCGHCADCLGPESQTQYCSKSKGAVGIQVDGSFADYEVIDSREACILPERLSFESAAPLACAGCTVWGGLMRADLKKGQWLALVGAGGGLGHLAVQFAKALGLQVIGLDVREEGLALATKGGADVVVDASQDAEKIVEEVQKVTGGYGADATINISDGKTAAAISAAITRMHCYVIQIAQVG
jgi:alcohol dehydrogenase, propanol-preferring